MVYVTKNTDEEINAREKSALVSVSSTEASGRDGGVLGQLSPKTALVIGLVGSIMMLCTIGFGLLIWLVFR